MNRYIRIFTGIAAVVATSLACRMGVYAATYEVMNYDGKTITIEEEAADAVVEKIRTKNGEEGVNLYIEAMRTGDYNKFYEFVGDTTETGLVEDYITLDDKGVAIHSTAQQFESSIQTLLGPTGNIKALGDAALAAGFKNDSNGVMQYYMAIVVGDAKRPDIAKDPVYRLAELNLHPRSMAEMELYSQQGIIVEYPDDPLTEFQKQIIAQYGLTIQSAADAGLLSETDPGDLPLPGSQQKESDKTQNDDQITTGQMTAQQQNTQESKTQDETKNLTSYQFTLVAIIVIIITFAATVLVVMLNRKKK